MGQLDRQASPKREYDVWQEVQEVDQVHPIHGLRHPSQTIVALLGCKSPLQEGVQEVFCR